MASMQVELVSPESIVFSGEATQVLAFVAEQIAIARNVESVGPPAEVVLVVQSLEFALGTRAEVMVHQVVAQLARAAAESTRPDVGRRAHQ